MSWFRTHGSGGVRIEVDGDPDNPKGESGEGSGAREEEDLADRAGAVPESSRIAQHHKRWRR